jgi:hypothetical protein
LYLRQVHEYPTAADTEFCGAAFVNAIDQGTGQKVPLKTTISPVIPVLQSELSTSGELWRKRGDGPSDRVAATIRFCIDDWSTTDQTTQSFSVSRLIFPDFETERSSRPSSMPAAVIQALIKAGVGGHPVSGFEPPTIIASIRRHLSEHTIVRAQEQGRGHRFDPDQVHQI